MTTEKLTYTILSSNNTISHENIDNDNSNNDNDNDVGIEHVDPELLPVLKAVSLPQIDTVWKATLLDALMHIPVPTSNGISSCPLNNYHGMTGQLFYNKQERQDQQRYHHHRPRQTSKSGGHRRHTVIDNAFLQHMTNKKKDSDAGTGTGTTYAVPSAIVWIHGGGRLVGSANSANDIMICTKLVEMFDVPVLSVHYTTSVRHPRAFPNALNDITHTYKSLVHYLQTLYSNSNNNLDDDQYQSMHQPRIIVAGESAGGGLAAELCQRLLDEEERRKNQLGGDTLTQSTTLPVAQLLIYPMLDDRTGRHGNTTTNSQHRQHLVWSDTSNRFAWKRYLGEEYYEKLKKIDNDRDSNTSNDYDDDNHCSPAKYISAARRSDLSGLPPAWIMVGSLDLFRNECLEYATRLAQDGNVTTSYVEVTGGFHAMFGMGRNTQLVGEAWQDMYEFGRRYLDQ